MIQDTSTMPTQKIGDSEDVNLAVISVCTQNGKNEENDDQEESHPKLKDCEEGLLKCKHTRERKRRKRRNHWIGICFVLTFLFIGGIFGWLSWLTFFKDMQTEDGEPGVKSENRVNDTDSRYTTKNDISGISMAVDLNSLYDKESQLLKFQDPSSKLNFSGDGVKYMSDGSFKILKSGKYIVNSKLSLINIEFDKLQRFRHCVMFGKDSKFNECDEGTLSPQQKKTSRIWFLTYLEKDMTVQVTMTNKGVVYTDPAFNKIQIVEYMPAR